MLFNRLFSLVKQGYLDVDSFRTYHVHSLIMGFVFNILRPFDMALAVTESLVMNIAGQVLTFLGLIGGYRGSDHGGNGRQRESDWIPGTLG